MSNSRYYIGDRIVVMSPNGKHPCVGTGCAHVPEVATTVVGYRSYGTYSYLVLSNGSLFEEVLDRENSQFGQFFGEFNLGLNYMGQRVVQVQADHIKGYAQPKKVTSTTNGLFCTGPCKNFCMDASVDTDPQANKDPQQWWCRTCRQDRGWMRE